MLSRQSASVLTVGREESDAVLVDEDLTEKVVSAFGRAEAEQPVNVTLHGPSSRRKQSEQDAVVAAGRAAQVLK